jgi:hypothetical protein
MRPPIDDCRLDALERGGSMRYVRACLALLCVGGAAWAAGETPTVDAFGREWDRDEALSASIPVDFQSDAWRAFALRVAREEGKTWNAAKDFVEIDIRCSFEGVKEQPQRSKEAYEAFLETEEGSAWMDACAGRLYNEPEAGNRLYQGTKAFIALGISLGGLLPELAERPPLDAAGVPPAEFELRAKALFAANLDFAQCLIEGADQNLSAEPRGERVGSLGGEMEKMLASGACLPEEALAPPAPPSAPAAQAADLPKDAFGRPLDVRFELRTRLGARLASPEQLEFAMAILEAEGDALARSARATPAAIRCSQEYLAEHPGHDAAAYSAFLLTPEGRTSTTQCTLRPTASGTTPAADVREGILAGVEIGMSVPLVVNGFVKAAAKRGEPAPDFAQMLQPDPIEQGRLALVGILKYSRCVIDHVVAKTGLEPLLGSGIDPLRPLFEEAVKRCPPPTLPPA